MSQLSNHDKILPMETDPGDAQEEVGIGQPVTQYEVDELLYAEDMPAAERLARLREFRDGLATREAGDFGDDDFATLLAEIDGAIERLDLANGAGDDGDAYGAFEPAMDVDPDARTDLLSPDDDARDAIVGLEDGAGDEDEDEDDGVLDPEEWDDGDGFRPGTGVH